MNIQQRTKKEEGQDKKQSIHQTARSNFCLHHSLFDIRYSKLSSRVSRIADLDLSLELIWSGSADNTEKHRRHPAARGRRQQNAEGVAQSEAYPRRCLRGLQGAPRGRGDPELARIECLRRYQEPLAAQWWDRTAPNES